MDDVLGFSLSLTIRRRSARTRRRRLAAQPMSGGNDTVCVRSAVEQHPQHNESVARFPSSISITEVVKALRPGLAPLVDGNCGSGAICHLHAMLLAAEGVGDIPLVGSGLAGHVLATLDVLGLRRLSAAVATDVGAHRAACDSATDRGCLLYTSDAADE